MIKNRYQEILVGMGLVSLIRGIISVHKKRTTLLVDDRRFAAETNQENFLSVLEISALTRLGKSYDIPELIELSQFLIPGALELVSDSFRLKLGSTPISNIRELLRKFPEFISAEELAEFESESAESLNPFILEELKRFELHCFETSQKSKGQRFEWQGPKWFKSLYQNFSQQLNLEYKDTKDLRYSTLLHLLGLSAEDKLKTQLSPEEVPFYFARILSPLWRLQEFLLSTQLKRRLMLVGGDCKESPVQYWQLHEGKFTNLLLESFEGVISGERVLFFSHFPADVPFEITSDFPIYRLSRLGVNRRGSSPFPPHSLTVITEEHLLGSQEPFRILARGRDASYYVWPYPNLPGSKPEFYQKEILASQDKDAQFIPFEKMQAIPQGVPSVILDMRSHRENRRSEAPILTTLSMEITDQGKSVSGFEYWGPYRYKSFGLLSLCYGIEGV